MSTTKAQRNWRERHPVLAAWHAHKYNAKKRGIAVEWDIDEFSAWCHATGYHILRKEGMTIDRIDPLQGYHLLNVQMISRVDNIIKGNKERHRYHWRRVASLLAGNSAR